MRAKVAVLLAFGTVVACNRGANEEAQKLLVRGCIAGNVALMEQGLALGADVNEEWMANSPLAWTVLNDRLAAARFLVRRGARINAHYGLTERTALQEAALRGNLELAKYLVEEGAEVNARNKFGRTALHHARRVLEGDPRKAEDVARFLVSKGAVE